MEKAGGWGWVLPEPGDRKDRGNTRSWPYFQEKNCKDGLREDKKSDGTRERLMDWRA